VLQTIRYCLPLAPLTDGQVRYLLSDFYRLCYLLSLTLGNLISFFFANASNGSHADARDTLLLVSGAHKGSFVLLEDY
jgi:hypothetical protein